MNMSHIYTCDPSVLHFLPETSCFQDGHKASILLPDGVFSRKQQLDRVTDSEDRTGFVVRQSSGVSVQLWNVTLEPESCRQNLSVSWSL